MTCLCATALRYSDDTGRRVVECIFFDTLLLRRLRRLCISDVVRDVQVIAAETDGAIAIGYRERRVG